jgi:hypothetical protein
VTVRKKPVRNLLEGNGGQPSTARPGATTEAVQRGPLTLTSYFVERTTGFEPATLTREG